MRPLEARLEHAPDPPIGIAEMFVDGRGMVFADLRTKLRRYIEPSDGEAFAVFP
jgi:hypothetical protein